MNEAIQLCTDLSNTKNFAQGATTSRSGSRNCQLFLATACAQRPDTKCHLYKTNNMSLPGFDLLNRPLQQSIDTAYIRNIALAKYLVAVPGCKLTFERLNPQDHTSVSVASWTNVQNSDNICSPVLALSQAQIAKYKEGTDAILELMIEHASTFQDILSNIHVTMRAANTWSQLSGTRLFTLFAR